AVDRVLVLGMGGNDLISAAAVSVPVILDGGDGDDTLIGGSGGDLLFAGPGNNSLVAGLGDDTLVGGGNDTLDGGAGNDTYKIHVSTATPVDHGGAAPVRRLPGPFPRPPHPGAPA